MSAIKTKHARWAVLEESSDSDGDLEEGSALNTRTVSAETTTAIPVVEVVVAAAAAPKKVRKSVRWADGGEGGVRETERVLAVRGPVGGGAAGMEEAVVVVLREARPIDTISTEDLKALLESGRLWGDIMQELEGWKPEPVATVTVAARRANTPADFWEQWFMDAVEEVGPGDMYDTRDCTEEEWEAMILWLHENGWWIRNYCRELVEADPDDGPRRTWISPRQLEEWAADEAEQRRIQQRYQRKPAKKSAGCCGGPLPPVGPVVDETPAEAVVVAPKVKKAPAPVPRFCREAAACTKEGCRYVHGNTIQRIDKPCGFGAECGKGDPAKRALCIYMHPGEVWSADLVVVRPE
jgi:hypothetical protein